MILCCLTFIPKIYSLETGNIWLVFCFELRFMAIRTIKLLLALLGFSVEYHVTNMSWVHCSYVLQFILRCGRRAVTVPHWVLTETVRSHTAHRHLLLTSHPEIGYRKSRVFGRHIQDAFFCLNHVSAILLCVVMSA